MRILAIAQLEDRTNLDKQILKQTVQPDRVMYYIDKNPAQGIEPRRQRIAQNHQKLIEMVKAYRPDLVWQLEGDCDLENNTLEKLLQSYTNIHRGKMGYMSGIQIGRHGVYCIGAWHVDEYGQEFKSLDYRKKGIQQVDATGFYCLLADTKVWLKGKASWDGERWGPDVNWGLSLGKLGYNIYCDMNIPIGHITKRGIIRVDQPSTCNARFYKKDGKWIFKQS